MNRLRQVRPQGKAGCFPVSKTLPSFNTVPSFAVLQEADRTQREMKEVAGARLLLYRCW